MRELEPNEGLVDQVEAPPTAADEAKLTALKTALEVFLVFFTGEDLAEDIVQATELIKGGTYQSYEVLRGNERGEKTENLKSLGREIETLCRQVIDKLMSKIPENLSLPDFFPSEDPIILALEDLKHYVGYLYEPETHIPVPTKFLKLGFGNIHLRRRSTNKLEFTPQPGKIRNKDEKTPKTN